MYMPSALLLTKGCIVHEYQNALDVAEVLAALHYMHRGVSNTELFLRTETGHKNAGFRCV
jgi:hypothetical protein